MLKRSVTGNGRMVTHYWWWIPLTDLADFLQFGDVAVAAFYLVVSIWYRKAVFAWS